MVSIIIPVLNEERALPGTLDALFRQEGDYEVIAVDGGSRDGTLDVLADFGFSPMLPDGSQGPPLVSRRSPDISRKTLHASRLFLSAPKGRATQMNAGAAVAQGGWLLFLHADTVLPNDALSRLNAMEQEAAVQAGGFRHRFSGTDWRLRSISWLDNFRCEHSRVIYGDQALFVRRSLFRAVGGFPDQPILEDVALCERLSAHTRLVLLDQTVITDARKFLAMGIGRSFLRVLLIILHVQFRLPVLPRVFFQDVR